MSADVCTDLSASIADLVGLPYQRGARLPGPATDCFGLLVEACRRRGLTIPDPFVSAEEPADARRWIMERLGGWVPCGGPLVGGVVEFRGIEAPAHVGYLINEREFLHSTKKTGAIVSRLDREPWLARLVGFYEYRGRMMDER